MRLLRVRNNSSFAGVCLKSPWLSLEKVSTTCVRGRVKTSVGAVVLGGTIVNDNLNYAAQSSGLSMKLNIFATPK